MKYFSKLLEQPGSRKGMDALVKVQALSDDLCTDKDDKTVSPSLVSALEKLETKLFYSENSKKICPEQCIEILEDAISCL